MFRFRTKFSYDFSKEWQIIRDNKEVISQLSKSATKIDRLLAYMLAGNAVTGKVMIEKFTILSYRDAIFRLGEKGYGIESKVIKTSTSEHRVWWLDSFSEEFVKAKDEKLFK